jgi:hypothetical protein
VRVLVYALPIVLSLGFVRLAIWWVAAPTGTLWMYLVWWLAVSLAATGVVWLVFRLTRRLLPLGALLELSLVFPDAAPSRFSVARRTRTVASLEERTRLLREAGQAPTTQEAAETLLGLVAALDEHDRITAGHGERVRAYSAALGRELALSDDELDRLNWAALLHDVGKLQVSPEILNKPGAPNDEERESLQLHPLFGEALVAPLREWLGEWIDAVGHHHERWDGTGYPRGLAEDEIPRAGRIVAIADAYDVITSVRSYKKPSRPSEARAELVRSAGTHFDPTLVRAFVGMSLGRMRLVVGPLAWLSHAPLLAARLPLTQSVGAGLGGVAAVAATTAAVAAGPPVVAPATASTPSVAATVQTRPAPSTWPRARVIRPKATPTSKPRPPANHEPEHRAKPGGRSAPVSQPEKARTPPQTSPPPGSGDGGDDPKTPPEPNPPAATPEPSAPSPIPKPNPPAPTPELPAPPPPPNAPPSFVAAGAQSVLEDAGAQATAWASSISPGPASDAGQTVRFAVSTDNPGLFAAQPAIAADGTLTYTPAPDAYGVATVSVTARDDGGTANGGVDASAPASFTITVSPVNDAPDFSLGGSQTALSVLGRQSVPGFASSIACGPSNESGQSASFVVTVDKSSLFKVAPTISADGTLAYTPKVLGLGVATVTVVAVDNGGTEHGGRDTSPPRTFTITVV